MDMTGSRTVLAMACVPGGVLVTAALSRSGVHLLEGISSPAGDPAAAVTGLAAAGAALIAGWLTLCLVLTLAAQLPGAVGDVARDVRDRVTPALVQRWAAVVLGASIGATIAPGTAAAAVRTSDAPALSPAPAPGFTTAPESGEGGTPATPSPGWLPGEQRPTTPVTSSAPEPGWVPSRPPARHRADPQLLTGGQRPVEEETAVVVRRGDTLWSIAATRLGPSATDVEIARAWPRWHETNRAVIGADPHTLLPGTQLTPPRAP